MPIQNKAMLITYSDSMAKNIKETHEVLKEYIGDAIGGVHLLPFFPSTGDRALLHTVTTWLTPHSVTGTMLKPLARTTT